MDYFLRTLPFICSGPLLLAALLALRPFWRACSLRAELSLWLLCPLLLPMALQVRDYRYLMPLAPAKALLTGCGIASLDRPARTWAAALAVGLVAAGWLGCSFSRGSWGRRTDRWLRGSPPAPGRRGRSAPCGTSPPAASAASPGRQGTGAASPLRHAAAEVVDWLGQRHALGRGAVLLADLTHPPVADLLSQVQRQLPGLRVLQLSSVSPGAAYRPPLPEGRTACRLSDDLPPAPGTRDLLSGHLLPVAPGPEVYPCWIWPLGAGGVRPAPP